jgi:hypothetical protein
MLNLRVIFKTTLFYVVILLIVFSFSACSSSPKISEPNLNADSSPVTTNSHKGPVNEVSIKFSDSVKEKLKNIDSFDTTKFCETIIDTFDTNNLFSASSDIALEVVVNYININTSPSIIYSDIATGSKGITGRITIKNKTKQIVGQYDITTNPSGTQENSVSDWMYTEFANLIVEKQGSEKDSMAQVSDNAKNQDSDQADISSNNSQITIMQVLKTIFLLGAFAAGYSAGL